jgi:UTP--glucose-1-phosphate uridylyltransferase
VSWPADPTLEWCPPGHGDLYTALLASGVLRQLLDAGFRYASVSNSDNLGAAPNPTIAGWFAASGAPYAAELCRRRRPPQGATRAGADRLARDGADAGGRRGCRTSAATAVSTSSQRPTCARSTPRCASARACSAADGPAKRRPSDKSSPTVYQLETAMARRSGLRGARALRVPRTSRQSDDRRPARAALGCLPHRRRSEVALAPQRERVPFVALIDYFKLLRD